MYNKCYIIVSYACLISIIHAASLFAKTDDAADTPIPAPTERVLFSFVKKPLLPIIQELARKKKVNLFVPQAAADLETLKQETITYSPTGRKFLPLDQAWDLVHTFLELAGFSLLQRTPDTYTIVRNASIEGGAPAREPLPNYIETPLHKLPRNDERIRYVLFLKNIKVPGASTQQSPYFQPDVQADPSQALVKMLKELSSKEAKFLFEPASNGIILIDKASNIHSIARLIREFDARGFKETVAFIPLTHVAARDVAQIFDSLKKAAGEPEERPYQMIRSDAQSTPFSSFTQDTKIIPEFTHNALIVMGKEVNVERISDFIRDYIDIAQEKGTSLLHSYDLNYLNAQQFAPILQNAVSSLSMPTNGQATSVPYRRGQEHYFKGPQIAAEEPVEIRRPAIATEAVLLNTKGGEEIIGLEDQPYVLGNRLIVVARQDDWRFIKQLIERLDKPQFQVILEVLIVDFTYSENIELATSLRSKTDSALPCGVEFLASHISPVNSVLGTTPTQLAEDLLQAVGPTSVTSLIPQGSVLISFNDPQTPGVFGLIQALQRVVKAKIRSYPYLVVSNNQKGVVESEEIRRATGDLVVTVDGSMTIPIEDISATIRVIATPHIVSDERVRLDIGFEIEQFLGANSLTRLSRGLKTTATLSSGQILAMGGLIRKDVNEFINRTPFFGRIPLLGWLFKRNNRQDVTTNIALFVCPTIIEPKSPNKQTEKTREKVCEVISFDRPLFNERDPINKLFLAEPRNNLADTYFKTTSNLSDLTTTNCCECPLLLKNKKSSKINTTPLPGPINQGTPKQVRAESELNTQSQQPNRTKKFNTNQLQELLAHTKKPFAKLKSQPLKI